VILLIHHRHLRNREHAHALDRLHNRQIWHTKYLLMSNLNLSVLSSYGTGTIKRQKKSLVIVNLMKSVKSNFYRQEECVNGVTSINNYRSFF
jgi:hypothetical protein